MFCLRPTKGGAACGLGASSSETAEIACWLRRARQRSSRRGACARRKAQGAAWLCAGAEHDARLAQVIQYFCDRRSPTSVYDCDDTTALAIVGRGLITRGCLLAPYPIRPPPSPPPHDAKPTRNRRRGTLVVFPTHIPTTRPFLLLLHGMVGPRP